MELKAITYIGRSPGFTARVENRVYDFEWQKSLGIGKKRDEVEFKHASILSKWKDRSGKKMFIIE